MLTWVRVGNPIETIKMSNSSPSSGGKADAVGGNYETRVAAWYCVRVLLGSASQQLFDLPSTTTLVSVHCQTAAPVDDVNVVTSERGYILAQAKRTVHLSTKEDSPLAQTIEQFVRQHKATIDGHPVRPGTQFLTADKDRLVLATRSASSAKIIDVLPRLLRAMRGRSDVNTLTEIQHSAEDLEVATAVETHIRRSWARVYGCAPTDLETGGILRLMWIHVLDVEIDERDYSDTLNALRSSLLEKPAQANAALDALVTHCGNMRGDRAGIDRAALLRKCRTEGIALRGLPDYAADVLALQRWTKERMQRARHFIQLIETEPRSIIRRSLSEPLRAASEVQSLLIVGEPGAGKSGVLYQLALDLISAGLDVVFLPVDLLQIDSLGALDRELGLVHPLAEALQNWPGSSPGLIIVDALDAARKPTTQAVLKEAIRTLVDQTDTRWNVVASVRRYDLRQGVDWARMFRGVPPEPKYLEREFPSVRHIAVAPLSDEEIKQTAASLPTLNDFVQNAPKPLRELTENIFNLHLLADLLHEGVVASTLTSIRNQHELLAAYWQHRIRREDGLHDAREASLEIILERMIAMRSLQINRADIRSSVDTTALVDLERHDILRAEEWEGRANEDSLLFSHHVLFDYAAARLIYKRGRDPNAVVTRLRTDPSLILMLNPSLSLALADAWDGPQARRDFWQLAFALSGDTALPGVAQLAGPMVAAERATNLDDLNPLLTALRGVGADRHAAEVFINNLIAALFVLSKSGIPLAGIGSGPWMGLAEAISDLNDDTTMFAIRPLIATVTDKPPVMSDSERASIGRAARGLLAFAWSRERRHGIFIANGINAVCSTIASDVTASVALLRRIIDPDQLRQWGYEELHWLARHIRILAKYDLDFVVDAYDAAYGFEDDGRDVKTDMGRSVLLSLSSNRSQDYSMSWHLLAQHVRAVLDISPTHGARAVARAVKGYVVRRESRTRVDNAAATTFDFNGQPANFEADTSYAWYRGGYRHPTDGPELLGKFDEFLRSLAGRADGPEIFRDIVRALANERGLAVFWASLLLIGAANPDLFASHLVPVACAHPVMMCTDTRHQLGLFITAAYPCLLESDRTAIEQSIMQLDGASNERLKKLLFGCMPAERIATDAARAMMEEGVAPSNTPAMQITSFTGAFDTDAYLKEEGVSLDDPANAAIRVAMRSVEALANIGTPGSVITKEIAIAHLTECIALRNALQAAPPSGLDPRLRMHAEGVLADAASRICNAHTDVLNDPEIRAELQTTLLFVSTSENPVFDQSHEDNFHTNLSWGGPSARTSAAHGLVCLVRSDQVADLAAMDAIHRLVNDPVACVRLQVVERLSFVVHLDPEWVWDTIEKVATAELTGGVVSGALQSLGYLVNTDMRRSVQLIKSIITKCESTNEPGIRHSFGDAATLLCDLSIWRDDKEANEFTAAIFDDITANPDQIRHFIARYSDALLAGDPANDEDPNHGPRRKVLSLYADLLAQATKQIEGMSERINSLQNLEAQASAREALSEMVSIVIEIAMRLHFTAAGTGDANIDPTLAQIRLYHEAQPMLIRLAESPVPQVAHHLVQLLAAFIATDPSQVFALITAAVRSSGPAGYGFESMAVDMIVRIVEQYLADHRDIFADPARLRDLTDCLDVFVRAGWPQAHSLTFRLGEIWR
jgi:hypothetical protein